jgi:hypothetical protein
MEFSRDIPCVTGDIFTELAGEGDDSIGKLSIGFRSKVVGSRWRDVRLPRW